VGWGAGMGGRLGQRSKGPFIINSLTASTFPRVFIIFGMSLIGNLLAKLTFPKEIPIFGVPLIINPLKRSSLPKEILIFSGLRSGKGLMQSRFVADFFLFASP
jgi:hypothetical protein